VRHANASALGPYMLLRLVIAMAGGVIVFRELPDSLSIAGSTLILASCALATVTRIPSTERISLTARRARLLSQG
jgi:drug/metabolite transporter (DMT)-like permease